MTASKTISFRRESISADNFECNYQTGKEILNNAINNLERKDNIVLPKNSTEILETLSKNKEELAIFFDEFYQIAQKNYAFPKSKLEFKTWKPTMNIIEAQNYVNGSLTQNNTYYRASRTPQQHKTQGYQLERVSPQYPGIFITNSNDIASQYGETPLTLKVRVNKIVPLKKFNGIEDNLLDAVDKKFSDKELKEALYNIRGLIEYEIGKKLNIDAFYSVHQSFEEDAEELVLTVLNPKNIVIVEN